MKNVKGRLSKLALTLILAFSLGVGPLPISATPMNPPSTSDEKVTSIPPTENEATTFSGTSTEIGQPPATADDTSRQLDDEDNAPILPLAVTYTVTFHFYDSDGNKTSETKETDINGDVVPPVVPDRPGYRFVDWNKPLSGITENLDVDANYVELTSFTVTVNYIFADNTIARQPVILSVEKGGDVNQTVASPTIAGYTPDQSQVVINLSNVMKDWSYTVKYTPASNTPYHVQYYRQKLVLVNTSNPRDPVNYDLYETQNPDPTGPTGSLVTATPKTYPGFTTPSPMPSAQIAADGSTTLKAYYDRNQYAVYFDSAGGSYVAPIAGLFGTTVTAPANPTRAGYTFDGWSAGVPVTMPAGDTTLTAKWKTAGTVNYTLVYYLENIGSTGYDYVGTATQGATAGATPTIPGAIPSGVTFPIASNRFALNSTKTNGELTGKTVDGNGTTIVNVYYDRNSYTINFNFDAAKYSLTVGGTTYTASPYKLTAKYGASIDAKWPGSPTLRSGSSSDGTFIGWNGSSITYVTKQYFLDDNIINNAPLTASWDKNAKNITVYYYFKNITDNNYTPNFTQTVAVDKDSSTWNAKSFQGFTVQQATVNITSNNAATFYYDRNSYKITYYNGGVIDRTSTNLYQADISGSAFSVAPSVRPANIPSDYTFAGWYTTPQGYDNTKFNFAGATMPANNLILYARWDKPNYTAVFNPDNGSPTFAQTVPALSTLTQPAVPTKAGYTFAGWYLPSATLKYTFSFPVSSNLSLTARWIPISNISYDVIYKKDGVEFQRQTIGGKSVGDSVTANAIAVPGYLPDALSKSLTLGASNNQIIFNYTPFGSVEYTVKYVDSGGDKLLDPITKTTSQASVTENYVNIPGYYPNYYQQTLVLGPNASANVITFVYTKNAPVNYTVRSLFENLDGSYAVSEQIKTAPAGTRVEEQPQTVIGFTFQPDLSINNRIIASDGSTVIRMVYNRNVYALAFSAGANGTLSGTAAFAVKYGSLYGADVITPTPVADPGYKFVGWDPVVPAVGTEVTGAASYTAKFEKDPTQWAIVTFDGNGSTSGSMSSSDEMLIGSSYTLPANAFGKTDYTFVDWDTKDDGTGTAYTNGQTIIVNGSMKLYAQWVKDQEYSVVYLGGGGTGTLTDGNSPYVTGKTVTVLGNEGLGAFTKPGYKFVNWEVLDASVGEGPYVKGSTFVIGKNTYLTAQWEDDPTQWLAISYNGNGNDMGSMTGERVLTNQDHALKANAYSKEHYTFVGWNTLADGSGTSYTDGQLLAAPISSGTLDLYAQWIEIPQHTITYYANGGIGDPISETYYEGSTVTIRANTFSYEHHDFARWTTKADGTGTSYFPGNATTLTSDIDLYALWMPRNLYSMTYNDGFSTGTFSESSYAEQDGSLDITVAANPFVRPGYSFDYWVSSTLGTAYPGNVINDINASTDFVAHWKPVDYSISYDLAGGILSGTNPTQYNIETPAFDIINPTMPGYTFTGWTGTGLSSPTPSLTVGPGQWGDLSFTANWVKDPAQWATVSFDGNGNDSGDMPPSTEMLVGSSYTLPANIFTRANYDFMNWDTVDVGTGVAYTDEQTIIVNSNMTLYAQRVGNESYKVVYLGNGGLGTLTDSNTYTYNRPVTVLDNTGLTAFVKPGYTFTGWEDQSGTPFAAGSTFNIQQNTFLSAQWAIDPSKWLEISYDGNGSDAGSMANEKVFTETSHMLASNEYTREGFMFAGWNTKADGSGASYVNNQVLDAPLDSGVLPLYAQWYPLRFTINYDLDGGTVEGNNPTEYNIETPAIDIINPTKPGYTFEGWTGTELDSPTKALTITTDRGINLSFTAHWAKDDSQWSTISFVNSDVSKGTISGVFEYEGVKGTPIAISGDTPLIVLLDVGAPISISYPTSSANKGYVFAGWDQAVPSAFPQSDLTITALWQTADTPVTPNQTTASSSGTSGSAAGATAQTGDPLSVLYVVVAGVAALSTAGLSIALRQRRLSKIKK